MKFRILSLLLGLAVLWGCQSGPGSSTGSNLPSGYEYILHTNIADAKKAAPLDLAFFRYAMRNDQETVISNFGKGNAQIIPLPDGSTGRALNPIEEALLLMGVGDSLTIIVPMDTIPVAERPKGFENADFLYYDLKLEELKSQADLESKVAEMETFVNGIIDQYVAGTLEGVQSTDSGLKYVIHKEGTGEVPDSADFVYVDYYGALPSKVAFDNSYKRGTPFAFQLGMGRVIPGWDEGLALLKTGSEATFFIPSDLGYGEAGSPPVIPGNSELIFHVNLVNKLTPEPLQ